MQLHPNYAIVVSPIRPDRVVGQPHAARDVDLATAGAHYIAQRRALGRKKSTLEDYESTLRVHLVPFFGLRPLTEIDVLMIESFITTAGSADRRPDRRGRRSSR
jgi:hypothetical protein